MGKPRKVARAAATDILPLPDGVSGIPGQRKRGKGKALGSKERNIGKLSMSQLQPWEVCKNHQNLMKFGLLCPKNN